MRKLLDFRSFESSDEQNMTDDEVKNILDNHKHEGEIFVDWKGNISYWDKGTKKKICHFKNKRAAKTFLHANNIDFYGRKKNRVEYGFKGTVSGDDHDIIKEYKDEKNFRILSYENNFEDEDATFFEIMAQSQYNYKIKKLFISYELFITYLENTDQNLKSYLQGHDLSDISSIFQDLEEINFDFKDHLEDYLNDHVTQEQFDDFENPDDLLEDDDDLLDDPNESRDDY